VTSAIHANLGTGVYPNTHGVAEITGRRPDGSVGDLYFEEETDPRLLLVDTLGDAWDRENANRAWVGMLGYESWHLGMLGKGARAEGGARDAAVLWDRDARVFWTNREVYSLPSYLPDRAALDRRIREMTDADGRWMGTSMEHVTYIPGTPAFVDHQGEALLRMLEREPLGTQPPTSLLFVELKASDTAGHLWNMVSDEMEAVLRTQDRLLGAIVRTLDAKVGSSNYVLAVTADHGQSPRPDTVGGVRIDRFRLQDHVNERFGAPVLETAHPDDVFVDHDVLEGVGSTLTDLARFIADLRARDVDPDRVDLPPLPARVAEEKVFAAALPGAYLQRLSEAEIAGLGPGRYREGDLTSSVPRYARLLSE
jgi:hypothetical protein